MPVRQRKFEVLGDELLDVRTLNEVGVGDFNDFEDLWVVLANVFSLHSPRVLSRPANILVQTYVNAPKPRTVLRCHILVHGLDSCRSAHLPIFLVHVVCAGSRIVSKPDTEVLDLEGALLVNLVQSHDLAVRLFDLSQLHEEVPEARLGHDCVVCEYAHAVEFRSWVGVGREVATDHLVFVEATWRKECQCLSS